MSFASEFVPLPLDQLRREAAVKKADGWRFMQTHAVKTDDGVDLYYSFMKNGEVVNYRIEGVTPQDAVPSITDLFLAAFVFENEARELFGVDMRDIAIDFQGAMYAPAESTPMTFLSPEQKAARDKARKAAAAKAAKEARKAGEGARPQAGAPMRRVFVMTPELQARLDAKLPTLSPEKRAKVEAALKARAEEAANASNAPAVQVKGEQPAQEPPKGKGDDAPPASVNASALSQPVSDEAVDEALERALGLLDSQKASVVRAALGQKSEPAQDVSATEAWASGDLEVDRLLELMDEDRAAKVKAALKREGE